MGHVTSIGLDVHARSITASAFDLLTGEIATRRFGYDAAEITAWILSFDEPKAVYEAGVTGFDLARKLRAAGIDCIVCAPSKMQRPPADARRKNDANDAEFLARLLATHNVVEVAVPDEECEAMHDLVRAHDDLRADLTRAKQRLNMFLIRHGYAWCEKTTSGTPRSPWSKAHWAWIRSISFESPADEDAFALYISEIRHLEGQKAALERYIREYARQDRWRQRVDALRCLKGIETITAFSLVVEAQVFSRFSSAKEYSAWLGLVPSEHSSGERASKGSITKTGNRLCRRLLVEAAWHYARTGESRKQPGDIDVPLHIQNHAARGIKRLVRQRKRLAERGKKPCVANVATARELACFVWAIGRMCEGTLA